MGLQIEDGLGRGFRAQVDDEGHLVVDSLMIPEIGHQSDAHGLTATWASTYASTAANLFVLSVQNDADENLHIHTVSFGSSAANEFKIIEVTSGTPGGSTIAEQNLNLISGVAKANTAFGNALVSGSLSGNTLWMTRVPALEDGLVNFDSALILGTADAIAIQSLSSGSVHAMVYGFWDTG